MVLLGRGGFLHSFLLENARLLCGNCRAFFVVAVSVALDFKLVYIIGSRKEGTLLLNDDGLDGSCLKRDLLTMHFLGAPGSSMHCVAYACLVTFMMVDLVRAWQS